MIVAYESAQKLIAGGDANCEGIVREDPGEYYWIVTNYATHSTDHVCIEIDGPRELGGVRFPVDG